MHFISILIVLIVLQLRRGWLGVVQNDNWFISLWQKNSDSHAIKQFVLAIVLPSLLLLLVMLLARTVLWGVGDLLLSVVLLMYALGRGHYISLYRAYKQAWLAADASMMREVLAALDKNYQTESTDLTSLHVDARYLFIYQAFTRLFVVLFWFSLCGPVLAVFYRLLKLADLQSDNRYVQTFTTVMEWPVARLFGLSVALLGNFSAGFNRVKQFMLDTQKPADEVVHDVTLAALNQDMAWNSSRMVVENDQQMLSDLAIEEMDVIHQLIHRCTVFAVVIIAVFHVII